MGDVIRTDDIHHRKVRVLLRGGAQRGMPQARPNSHNVDAGEP